MDYISDNVLINELKKRFSDNKKALKDLKAVTKKLEAVNQKLKDSEELKSNFLSNIRNEINNPLTSIIGLAEQIASGVVPNDDVVTIAHMIYTEGFELDFQLKNIFVAAELEAGETTMNVAQINIGTFIRNIVQFFFHISRSKQLKVNVICKDDVCDGDESMFFTDPEKLQLIMVNILSNALEFSPNGGEVTINVWKEKGDLNISVKDLGEGIATKKQKEIFDRFKQLSTGTRKSHKGHGLGLSIVKSLLSILNGDISLKSDKGKGSTFTVSIPEHKGKDKANAFSEDGNEFIFDDPENTDSELIEL